VKLKKDYGPKWKKPGGGGTEVSWVFLERKCGEVLNPTGVISCDGKKTPVKKHLWELLMGGERKKG